MFKLSRVALTTAAVLAAWPAWAAGNGYFRFPSVRNDTLVFTAEGDLWSAPASGGNARRLTTHPAEENRSSISPDGKWVAFSAAYEGPTEVYVMPLAGGLPKRVSFENSRAFTLGWTPQGEVLFSAQHATGPNAQRVVAAVAPKTLAKRIFPLADANDAVLDDSGEYLYFVRFGLATTGDNARHYRGGALSQLWRYALKGGREAERIGPQDSNLRRPMWWNGQLVVISDQSGRDNLWSMQPDGSNFSPLTQHTTFDVRSASMGNGRIVYQLGADLRLYELAAKRDQAVPISLASDFDQMRPRWLEKPLRYMSSSKLAAEGDKVAITARGRVTVAGIGPIRRVDITQPPGSRLGAAVIGKDGKWLYAICDASGEQEIWRFPADGGSGGHALTHDGSVARVDIYPSPDGKWLAHSDKRGRLWLLELASGKNELADDGSLVGSDEYADIVWSPDSRAIALVRPTNNRQLNQIGLYSLEHKRTHWLTSDKYESTSPSFSPDNKWLWFLSNRSFQLQTGSTWGDRNTGAHLDRRGKIYALALQAANRFPFQPKDELQAAKPTVEDKPADAAKPEAKEARKSDAKPAAIQFEGLAERLFEVPLPAGNFKAVQSSDKRLYLLERNDGKDELKSLAIDNTVPKAELFVADVNEFALSQDGKKLFYRKGDDDGATMYIVDAAAKVPAELGPSSVRIGDWRMRIDPPQEWRQMFADSWRVHRDQLYDRQLRGVDWLAVRKQYLPLLDRVSDRSELDDVLAQMVAEVGSLHSQVVPGDVRRSQDGATAAGLGALLEPVINGWKVAHIYKSERELPSERSPLQAPGVDVRVGDVIVAVNGYRSNEMQDISELLRNQAGQQVLLEVKRGETAVRRVVVTPVNAQQHAALRYTDWEQRRLELVERAGQGKLGYLHLRAMGSTDMASFVREFYGQYERDGLIIDVRRNNGGNIDSWIIEKLLRRVWAYWAPPGTAPYANMQQTFRGHLVVLTDALTYSDGETFAAGIKALKLGPLIGTRTAGAGVWLSDRNNLVDAGRARVAESPQYGMDGRWIIEGDGVQPDMEVDNPPHATFMGEDKQLAAAIAYLQRKLASEPVAPLKPQAVPALR
ncbi:peptidase S41 [Chitinimonas arctica]|uniref:Tricorn protease homolog n=1 Tax=Chitinimonas arctica TaxID=2594795 RepID=A0A516SBK3_9NEIS|nr:S41 family peptidase [Chitinimonas arctica]QDQ25526.1 peptidase S41 [Chitinimonas arctica]